MDWNWEDYTEGPQDRSGKSVRVTIYRDGNFFFNRTAMEMLGEPDGVVLMYDKKRSAIGVKASTLNREGAFTLRRKWGCSSKARVICAQGFCRRFTIQPSESVWFPNAEVNREGIMILDLNDAKSVKT